MTGDVGDSGDNRAPRGTPSPSLGIPTASQVIPEWRRFEHARWAGHALVAPPPSAVLLPDHRMVRVGPALLPVGFGFVSGDSLVSLRHPPPPLDIPPHPSPSQIGVGFRAITLPHGLCGKKSLLLVFGFG
jgi:hypothetical protein